MSLKGIRTKLGVVICSLALVGGLGVGLTAAQASAAVPNAAVAAVAPATGTVVMLPPTRIADSRTGAQLNSFFGFARQDLQVAAHGGVPLTGAAGAILSVTVVSNSYGFLSVYPSGGTRPEVSQVSFNRTNVSTEVTVQLSSDGSIRIFSGAPGWVDVLVDVEGYVTA